MKKHFTALIAPLALLPTVIFAQTEPNNGTHGDPYYPVGTLGVNPTFVQTGVKPNLGWEIDYPSVFQDLAVVGTSGSLSTTQEVTMVVQIPGASGGIEVNTLPVAVWLRVGLSSSWQLVHNGPGSTTNPSKVLYRNKIPSGTKVDFAARVQHPSGGWRSIVWTIDSNPTLKTFKNGDPTPQTVGGFVTGDVESFLTPYLTEDASKVVLGPKELLYLFELEAGTPGSAGFDYEDLAITVQFITKNNNGHGNNIDGVDVSNPGQGGGGPNGQIDASGTVDDEQPKGNGKKN